MLGFAQDLSVLCSGTGVDTLYIRYCNGYIVTNGNWWQSLIAIAAPTVLEKLRPRRETA